MPNPLGPSRTSGRVRAASHAVSYFVVFLATFVILFAALGMTTPHALMSPSTGTGREDQIRTTHDTRGLAPAANSTFCGLIASYGNALPEPDTANFFARLCVQSEFQSLVASWGGLYGYYPFNGSPIAYAASNLTPGWGGGDGWTDIEFTINWASSSDCGTYGTPCAHQAYWLGNETTGNLSGPNFETYPLTCYCGDLPRTALTSSPGTPIALGIGVVPAAVAVGFIFAILTSRRGKAGQVASLSRK
jgi:hypothetical protein